MSDNTETGAADRAATIDRLILNPPYDEPTRYWKYHRETRDFELRAGRRPAGYVKATPGAKGFDDPGVFVEMPLVNAIRERVRAWREAGYPNAEVPARELLEHWYGGEEKPRSRRFFFCQLEAIETLIWLTEAPASERAGLVIEGDGGDFARVCTKLATGTGKTVVMAMVIAWQVCSRMLLKNTDRYSRAALVMAPGRTVRNRLSVLHPDDPKNYYRAFDIVPSWLWDRFRREARVEVRNWQSTGWEDEAKVAKKKGVDKRGAKSDAAWVREKLGVLADERNLMVLNDEAHHAWRTSEGRAKGVEKEELDQATRWVAALDRVHRARGIRSAYDFSATPFVPGGGASSEESLFSWVVSDFGLNDAIESGLVKTPRAVVRDDALPDTKSFRSKLFHLYADPDVKADLQRPAPVDQDLPTLVVTAYTLLGTDWEATRKEWAAAGSKVPPVMISVANRTETAARITRSCLDGSIPVPALRDAVRTLHIDSKVLKKAESQEVPIALEEGADASAEEDESEEEDSTSKKVQELRQAERLRRMVDTVGQVGEPGQDIQHVIAVSMLSEGWDARTVTHIMGLRAFGSQLLCEQVVGRGLRRLSYDVDPATGLLAPEYVNVFGVPFTFLPQEGVAVQERVKVELPKTRVASLPERAEYEIRWPNVARIDKTMSDRLKLDESKVTPLVIRAADFPLTAELAPMLEGKPFDEVTSVDIRKIAEENRLQRQIFYVAKKLFDRVQPGWRGSPALLIAEVVSFVEKFMASPALVFQPDTITTDDVRRRVLLLLSAGRVTEHLWTAIEPGITESLSIVLDTERPWDSTAEMEPWFTSRPCAPTVRSQIDVCVFDSTWEATEAWVLDDSAHVAAWAKNDHLGFEIDYRHQGALRRYRPDFLVRLVNGTTLVLEVKGLMTEEVLAKRSAMERWCRAVAADGRWGHWITATSFAPKDVESVLARAIEDDVASPRATFRRLAAQWEHETGGWSNPHKRIAHQTYREIIAMGWKVVPFVLEELAGTEDPDVWGPALREITGERVSLAPEDGGRLDRVAAAWLALAKSRGWRNGRAV